MSIWFDCHIKLDDTPCKRVIEMIEGNIVLEDKKPHFSFGDCNHLHGEEINFQFQRNEFSTVSLQGNYIIQLKPPGETIENSFLWNEKLISSTWRWLHSSKEKCGSFKSSVLTLWWK